MANRLPSKSASAAIREALVTVRSSVKGDESLTQRAADDLVGAVRAQTGLHAEVAGVLSSLRSFRVRAPEAFLHALSQAPTVEKVQAYETGGSAKIEPVNSRPISLPD